MERSGRCIDDFARCIDREDLCDDPRFSSNPVRLENRAILSEIIAEILSTQAILIVNHNAEHKDLVELIRRRLEGYITAKNYVMVVYNISNDLLADVLRITPGKRSPTITSLDDGQSKSVSSLVTGSAV